MIAAIAIAALIVILVAYLAAVAVAIAASRPTPTPAHACQCPHQGAIFPSYLFRPEEMKTRAHAPGECPGDYRVRLYQRGKERLWLCSACDFPTDKAVEE